MHGFDGLLIMELPITQASAKVCQYSKLFFSVRMTDTALNQYDSGCAHLTWPKTSLFVKMTVEQTVDL